MDGSIKKTKGNDSKVECLPSRFALATVTKGDPQQRVMNNYAKKPHNMVPMPYMGMGYSR